MKDLGTCRVWYKLFISEEWNDQPDIAILVSQRGEVAEQTMNSLRLLYASLKIVCKPLQTIKPQYRYKSKRRTRLGVVAAQLISRN